MMQNDVNTYERKVFKRWLGISLSGLLLVGVGARWIYGNQDPGLEPPAPVVVPNNRFEELRQVGVKVSKDHSDIGAAFDRATKGEASIKVDTPALLARHRDTLQSARQVLGQDEFRMPTLRSMHDLLPYLAHFRDLGRLFIIEGREYEKKGDCRKAADCYLDALRLGERISHGSTLIGHLVSIAVSEIALRPLYEVTAKLDPETATRAARELQHLTEETQTMAQTMTEEKYAMQGGLLEVFRHPERFKPSGEDNFLPPIHNAGFVYVIAPKREVYANISGYMDAIIERMDDSYSRAKNFSDIPFPKDIFSQVMFPVFSAVTDRNVQHLANRAIVATRLELYASKGRTGQFPTWLYKTPADPFMGSNSQLGYRRDDKQPDGFLLYSVGPDGKDDNGTAIDNPKEGSGSWPEAARRKPFKNSVGDIVAGVNYPIQTK